MLPGIDGLSFALPAGRVRHLPTTGSCHRDRQGLGVAGCSPATGTDSRWAGRPNIAHRGFAVGSAHQAPRFHVGARADVVRPRVLPRCRAWSPVEYRRPAATLRGGPTVGTRFAGPGNQNPNTGATKKSVATRCRGVVGRVVGTDWIGAGGRAPALGRTGTPRPVIHRGRSRAEPQWAAPGDPGANPIVVFHVEQDPPDSTDGRVDDTPEAGAFARVGFARAVRARVTSRTHGPAS